MTRLKRVATLFMILAVVGSVVAGAFAGSAAAAQPTTESSSDIDEGTTWVDFNASSDDRKLVEFNNTDAADGALVVWDPDTGDNASNAQKHLTLDNSSDEFESTSSGSDSYAFNITADQLETIPMEAGENKSVKFTIANQSDWDADNADLLTLNVTIDNTMERSVMYIGDQQVEQGTYGIEQTDKDGYTVRGYTLPFGEEKQTKLDATRDIDGSNTTVHMYLANDTTASHFDSEFSEYDSESWAKTTLTQLDDENTVKNYVGAVPSDVDNDTTTLTYESGSTDKLVLDLGSDYDGQSTVDVSVNSDPGFWERVGAYGAANYFGLSGTLSLSLAGLVVSRRRLEA